MAIDATRLMDDILPKNATAFERALASMVDRLLNLGIPIRDLWSPERCPIEFLPYLAWTVSVDLWGKDWPEEKQRHVVSQALLDHKMKGTLALHERYIEYAGAKLLRATTAPQAFFAGPDDDGPLYDKWLAGLPEIQIQTLTDSGLAINLLSGGGDADELLPAEASAAAGYSDLTSADDVATWFAGPAVEFDDRLIGTYHDGGKVTPVSVTTRPDPRRGKRGTVYDIAFDGDAAVGFFADDALSSDGFLQGSIDGQTVTLKFVPGENDGGNWNLFGLEKTTVQDVAPVKVPIPGPSSLETFADQSFETSFVDADDPETRFYYSFRAYRGDVPTPSASFLDFDRFGMKPFTAEFLVEIPEPALTDGLYVGGYFDATYATPDTDLTRLWAATDAAVSAKALRDTILFDLDTSSNKTFTKRRSLKELTF